MLNDQVMLVSFLYNIRADFPFLSFVVSETYCVLMCGVHMRVGMSVNVVLCCVYCELIFVCVM